METYNAKNLKDYIRKRALLEGMTISDISIYIGVSKQVLSNLDKKSPSKKTLMKLSSYFNVDIVDLEKLLKEGEKR